MNFKPKYTKIGETAVQSFKEAVASPRKDTEFRLRQVESQSARLDNADARMYSMAGGEGRAPGTITCGVSANRPNETYMKTYGINNALYFSTDTFTLSAWTGTAWKSVTLA